LGKSSKPLSDAGLQQIFAVVVVTTVALIGFETSTWVGYAEAAVCLIRTLRVFFELCLAFALVSPFAKRKDTFARTCLPK